MHLHRFSLRSAVLPLAFGTLLAGCTPDQSEPTPNAGTLDVAKYLAVGDGYTAGLSDGGLTATSQEYAYPALIARQIIRLNPEASFTQGLLPAGTGTGYLTLRGIDDRGLPQTSRVTRGRAVRGSFFANPTACGGPDTTFLYAQAASSPLSQNLGVPGLGLTQIEVAGLGNTANQSRTGSFNPYFERLLPANDNRTYLQAVTDASASASFFTFFMGLGDALPYVLSGGECGSFPNTTTLNANAKKVLDRLTSNSRKGVIALLPTLQNLPVLRLGGKDGIRRTLTQGASPDSIYVRSAPANVVRAIDAGDFILPAGLARLGAAEQITLPNGTTVTARYGLSKRNPLVRRDVLDYFEFSRVNSPLVALNTELDRLAKTVYKLPTVNLDDELFTQVNRRISVNGVEYSSEPVRGNFYSLDLYSLTPRGNALLANTFIKVINANYQANIPFVDPNSLPTTARPQ
ncbi:hypothetical protein [Hymenobacter metallilatus]|uniref:G-D-S-L family lipolytic protein n=1 Tax=Hymenobacter metallilatus TaxID=2493666 RepID=A0A3R9LV52_9BACT|nr:hypothetical protein [Hymenobacter metallilatus]RSK24301.1 hypothetical protein EI290_20010 [Hymenobacter metallilatus]